ncbi:BatD family protein [Vibrio sp. Y2-5]|uniref:BatD family protein n=1 Tax=Vibrio TaxID=662 RepID=UPI00142D37AC|nr:MULTISPECIES: BatD family protein [Vibrio]MBD0786326.1 BatD family protein [Vibrio sp. Y2-5]NIY92155.1 protein BatD [Vibrio diazotrophicus]
MNVLHSPFANFPRFKYIAHLGRLALFLVLTAFSLNSFSVQAASFYASVSKNKVVKNEVFQLRVVSDQKASSDDIDFNVLSSDFLLGRPSFGSSINIINGTRSNKSEWTISLAATHIGIVTIPSFEINGQKTQPIAIQVAQDEQAPEVKDLVEVQTQLSTTELYPNESALLKARLIIKADPRRLQNPTVSPPAAEGLELKAASEANQYQTVLDGVEVTVVDQDFRITAKEAGTYQLNEPVFKGTIVYGNNYSSGTRLVPIETKPKTYSITVNPKPSNYQGIWLPTSKLSLTQKWTDSQGNEISGSTYKTQVGESITREVNLQVSGLTQEQLPNIKLNYPASLSVYDEKPQFTTLENGDVVMTVKQVLIPRKSGDIALPEITVDWWNTTTKQQQASKVSGLTLNVKQNDTPLVAAPTPEQPTPKVETITVQDAGFWPYLAALFAVLWVITCVLAWRFRSSTPNQTATKEATTSTEYQAVKNSLSGKVDGIAMSAAIKAWLNTVVLEEEEQVAINKALNEINQALYSSTPQEIKTDELEKLVERIQKQQAKRSKAKPVTLAKL